MAQHIATAAARLFATRGYDATSVREIVEAAGVAKPTLYYHFGSKEALGQALLTVPMERLIADMRAGLDSAADPASSAVAVLEAHFRFAAEDIDRTRFLFALFFGPLSSGLAQEMVRLGGELDELWSAAARRLAEGGVIGADRAVDFEVALRGLMIAHTMGLLFRGGELPPGLACRLVDDLLRGFGAGGRQAERGTQS